MRSWLSLMVFVGLTMVPAVVYAQASITGVVQDSSGGVLPGVTVEAASPALIEQVRVAVTDGTGQYRILNLRPGTYSVTFTLTGFSVVNRDGLELEGTFTATVNAELQVGTLEETITVTGESPVVDVQTTAKQRVINQEVLDALPAGRVLTSLAALTPGITANNDVGGNLGDGQSAGGLRARGSRDARVLVGGVPTNTSYRLTQGSPNVGAYQEITVNIGGVDAEQAWGGVHVNVIPREGGNTFSGTFYTAFADDSMASDNLTQELKDRGLGAGNTLKQLWDTNPTVGGPIVRDKLWFNTAARYNRAFNFESIRFNKNAGDPTKFTYDPGEQAANEHTLRSFTNRLTWQANPQHKIAFQYESTHQCDCPRQLRANRAPEANVGNYTTGSPFRQFTGAWTSPISNRLLLEASVLNLKRVVLRKKPNPFFPTTPSEPLVGIREQSTGLRFRGTPNGRRSQNILTYGRAVASYVTGAHSFKAGFVFGNIRTEDLTFTLDAPMEFRVRNGVPNRLTLHATPFETKATLDADHGLFVQDQWTRGRVTMSGGLRYSFTRITYPEVQIGPSVWTPDRNITSPGETGATWHTLSPRTSLAVDIFGTGKTALKASFNHYVVSQDRSTIFGSDASPGGSLSTRTNRSWRDTNGNFVPDCDLVNPAANGECGRFQTRSFGTARPGRTYDPDTLGGGRYDNWQFSVGVQQEIAPGVSVDAVYWRTEFGNIIAIDNRAVSASDFDEFSITVPVDPRLPGGGGNVLSGLFDINPAKFGEDDAFVTRTSNFGNETDVFNGFDLTINARPGTGVLVQGGMSTERRSTNNCDLVTAAPEVASEDGAFINRSSDATRGASIPRQFCDANGTFRTMVKLLGSVVIPVIDVQLSASLQNLPGPEIRAELTVRNSVVRESLGRSLSGRARNVTVNLIEPRTQFGERSNQLDLRFAKILRFGGTRATVGLDVFNALNSSDVLELDEGFDNFLTPEEILSSRFVKFVFQFDF